MFAVSSTNSLPPFLHLIRRVTFDEMSKIGFG